jgi:acetyltransferase-like isoleucine patch superfamily enzyme
MPPTFKSFTNQKKEYSNYDIGDYTYGSPEIISFWRNDGKLKIGKFCSIATGVKILLGGNHFTEYVSTYPFSRGFPEWEETSKMDHVKSKGDVIIENDVWIGIDSIILSGSKICNGAVVAAGSIVAGTVHPYSIYGGNPAKMIKKRFSDENIESLLKIQWWNWPIQKIKENSNDILNSNTELFIKKNYIHD